MPRPRGPLSKWHPYDWGGEDASHVSANVIRYLDEIAALLDLDPEAAQARGIPSSFVRGDPIRSGLRKGLGFGEFELVSHVDSVRDELLTVCLECLARLANEDVLASPGRMRQILKDLATRSEILDADIAALDPGVRALIAKYYPVDRSQFAPGCVEVEDVKAAATTALAKLPAVRGRPAGRSRAADRFSKDLRVLFENWSPIPSGRSVWSASDDNPEGTIYKEGGKFRRFVEIALGTLPEDARRRLIRSGGGLDYLVRRAFEPTPTG